MLAKNYWEIIIKPFPYCAILHEILNVELKMIDDGGSGPSASIHLKFEIRNLNYVISKIY